MKKLKVKHLILTVLLAVFLSFKSVEAKSGCCSSHGGVDCSAGAQSNGHVICYDGWRGSSCLYSEMVKCGGSSTSTTEYQPSVQTTPVAPIVVPSLPPSPVIIYVYPSLVPSPNPSPKPSPIPSPIQSSRPTPSPPPEVLGEKTESSSSDGMVGLAALGGFGYIIWRAIKKKWMFNKNGGQGNSKNELSDWLKDYQEKLDKDKE